MQFGKNLKYFRKRAGLTQKQLAQKLGMTYRAYQYYESGDKFPNLEKAIRLAEILHTSLDELTVRIDCTADEKKTKDSASSTA